MQETRNNCFGSKKCSTTLRQAKTGKHECRNNSDVPSMVENHFENNTIKCKKLTTVVSGRKNVARPFVRRKQVSTSAEK